MDKHRELWKPQEGEVYYAQNVFNKDLYGLCL